MSNQLWRLDEQTKDAVLEHMRTNRYVAELKRDLEDFRELFWRPSFPEQRVWAKAMIKSCEHELEQIEAGNVGAPDDWQG